MNTVLTEVMDRIETTRVTLEDKLGVRSTPLDKFFEALAGRAKVLSEYTISLVQTQCAQILFNAEHRGRQIPVVAMPGPDPQSPILAVRPFRVDIPDQPDRPDYMNHPNFQDKSDEESDLESYNYNDQDSGLISRSLNLTNL